MRSVVGAVLVAGVLVLTGCVQDVVIPTLPPSPTSTPIFASEEEALAAAEAAYAAYLEMSTLIANEGGAQPERIAPFVTQAHLAEEVEGLGYYAENGVHAEGSLSFDSMRLQFFDSGADTSEVRVYVCADASETILVNSSGEDVTPADRDVRIPLEVSFEVTSPNSVLLSESSVWAGDDFC